MDGRKEGEKGLEQEQDENERNRMGLRMGHEGREGVSRASTPRQREAEESNAAMAMRCARMHHLSELKARGGARPSTGSRA